jgi:hypothetical protein
MHRLSTPLEPLFFAPAKIIQCRFLTGKYAPPLPQRSQPSPWKAVAPRYLRMRYLLDLLPKGPLLGRILPVDI